MRTPQESSTGLGPPVPPRLWAALAALAAGCSAPGHGPPAPLPVGPVPASLEETAESTPQEAAGLFENPSITIYANVLGRMDDTKLVNEDGDELDDRIRIRELELDLRGDINEWSRAVAIPVVVADPVNEYDIDIEQAYFELHRFPWLEQSDWGANVKVGVLRSSFGSGNELRLVEIPQPTRPPSLVNFLGENGFTNTGASGALHYSSPGDKHDLSATLELTNNGDIPLADTSGDEVFASVLSLDWTWHIAQQMEMHSGVSGYRGKQDGTKGLRSHLLGIDWLMRLGPESEEDAGGAIVGGELFSAQLDRDDKTDDEPGGFYLWGQYEVASDWYLGARYDSFEDLEDPSLESSQYGGYVTYVWNKNVRMSLGYEHTTSDIADRDGANAMLFELNFAFGSAPLVPFWSNSK